MSLSITIPLLDLLRTLICSTGTKNAKVSPTTFNSFLFVFIAQHEERRTSNFSIDILKYKIIFYSKCCFVTKSFYLQLPYKYLRR